MPTAAEIAALNSDEINPDRGKITLLSPNFFRSEENGLDYCKIVNMHDQGKNEVIQLVNASHIRRWPRIWEAYQHGRARAVPTGTPLRQVLGLDEANILILKQYEIPNAESLADAGDELLSAILGGNGETLRASARQLVRLKQFEAEAKARAEAAKPAPSDGLDDTPPLEMDVAAAAESARAAHADRVRDVRMKQGVR